MYCPKCKEGFEEGSRRFCPTDGSRLISDTGDPSGNQWEGGIFASLIPRMEPIRDLDEALPEIPRFVVTEMPTEKLPPIPMSTAQNQAPNELGSDFFVLDDIEPDPPRKSIIANTSDAPAADRPAARKVNPYEIPAGHVELGVGDRLSVSSAEFQEDDPESFVGRTVKGRYVVTELLGGEDSSFSFLADDKLAKDKKVLVRILLEDDRDEIMGSILDEERVSLSHVSHPNIARLIDSGQFTDRTRFIISEYVDALSVSDILSIHRVIGAARAGRIVKQVASALSEVHQEGILHRDLKPSNIIVDPTGGDGEHAYLVNFGASSGEPTKYNVGYKAPDVLDGRVATITSDLYSLAVVAYEMVTGHLPFKGLSAREIMRSQYVGLAELPSAIRPDLSAAVDSVFQKALAFHAADRYRKARDLGDALHSALIETEDRVSVRDAPPRVPKRESVAEIAERVPPITLKPLVHTDPKVIKPETEPTTALGDEPAWTRRSPEPPEVGSSRKKLIAAFGIPVLLVLLGVGWYYVVNHPVEPEASTQVGSGLQPSEIPHSSPLAETEMPPLPRAIPQPPNTSYYQNSKQNLKGDLLRNFVGFSLYYPKDWKVNGPQESATSNTRGKFLDIARIASDGRLKEQMLVSYYPSKGTFKEDTVKFPEMVKETNDTLKKILPGYQMVSEGEIKMNGDWRAYEIKFQGGGTSPSGEKIVVWGRRLFIPAARPGVRDGFEITMLATSAADDVRSVDDVGVRGELAPILYSFEPSQNF